ncbi:MAG TPA: hypothetical protein VIC00_00455 [Candidatus Acidoferrales bacterium]
METREKQREGQIVTASQQALVVRSAALVVRGLRDLARDSNWLIKKVFPERAAHLSISSTGQVAAIGARGARRAVLYDIERCVATLALSVPEELAAGNADCPAAFAWSPEGNALVAAWGAWRKELHYFDLRSKLLAGSFGEFETFPGNLAWSATAKYFAAAASGERKASLRMWEARRGEAAFARKCASEIGEPVWIERQTYEAEFGEEGAFQGYGCTAFSPREKEIATVVEFHGEWADDFIAVVDAPAMQSPRSFQAQGHVTALTWTADSRAVVYCASGQAYRLDAGVVESELLPFGAELCACHPQLPLCVCFSSWLKNSAKGRLFVADLQRMEVLDECAAEGVLDLQWSADGSKAYAVTQDGLGYIYEPYVL